jgi:hypothetical protein
VQIQVQVQVQVQLQVQTQIGWLVQLQVQIGWLVGSPSDWLIEVNIGSMVAANSCYEEKGKVSYLNKKIIKRAIWVFHFFIALLLCKEILS